MADKVQGLRDTDTKVHIEGAPLDLLETEPIDHVSVRKITERAGINRATFYAHYTYKYQLFDAMTERSIRSLPCFSEDLPLEDVPTVVDVAFDPIRSYLGLIKRHCPTSYQNLFPRVKDYFIQPLVDALERIGACQERIESVPLEQAERRRQAALWRRLAAALVYEAAEMSVVEGYDAEQVDRLRTLTATMLKR